MMCMLHCLLDQTKTTFDLISFHLRLRAAIFVNLVLMRKTMSRKNNPGYHISVSPENLERLHKACFLFKSAHNSVHVASSVLGLFELWFGEVGYPTSCFEAWP